jgi:hypothetical protein
MCGCKSVMYREAPCSNIQPSNIQGQNLWIGALHCEHVEVTAYGTK